MRGKLSRKKDIVLWQAHLQQRKNSETFRKSHQAIQAPLILAHLLIQTHRLQEDLEGTVMNHCKANASVMQTECEFSCFTVPPIWTCLWKVLAHGYHRFPPDFCHHACLLTLLLSCWMYGRSDRTEGAAEVKKATRAKSSGSIVVAQNHQKRAPFLHWEDENHKSFNQRSENGCQ